MKALFVYFFFFLAYNDLWAQPVNTAIVPKRVRASEALTPATLAKKLIESANTDEEKVRVIFDWITDNIAYNTIVYQKPSRTIGNRFKSYVQDDDTSSTLLPLNERVARMVLQRRVAVCDGYARLFKTLCDYAGLRSEIIYGYARTNMGRVGKHFFSNHTWNAVYLNNSWQLLDVTWASGYISYGSDAFVKHLNENYYLTPPQQFIEDHYPELVHWSLLSSPPSFREFQHSPFKSQDYIKFKIQSFKPATGVIEAAVGDTLVFELDTEEKDKKLFVTSNPYLELGIMPHIKWLPYKYTASQVKDGKVSYTYVVTSPLVNQLHVIYNGRTVLQYRVDIKNQVAVK